MRARDIIARGHPLPKCMECVDLPPEVKARAQANTLAPQKMATFAQLAEGASTLETYM